jgi:hypothetical protein
LGQGVVGQVASGDGVGVSGVCGGVNGHGVGVSGICFAGAASGNSPVGVRGVANGQGGIGVLGVQGANAGAAGWFTGHVTITGTLTNSNPVLQLDHPDAPAQRWYRQALVGSFEQVSMVGGNAVTGATGRITVRVPAIFARHHRDVRYQLTPLGDYQKLYVAHKLDRNGRFTIAADRAGLEVSWLLLGVRSDPAATKQPLRVEARKAARYRGRYAQPELYDQARTLTLVTTRKVKRPRRRPERESR